MDFDTVNRFIGLFTGVIFLHLALVIYKDNKTFAVRLPMVMPILCAIIGVMVILTFIV